MSLLTCVTIGICAGILQGCTCGRMTHDVKSLTLTSDSPADKGPERAAKGEGSEPTKKEEPKVLDVQRLALTEKSLTIDYRVKNIFAQDIWVCEDIDSARRYGGKTRVETRIKNDLLQINLFGNLESNLFFEREVSARYRRLPLGQSCSQTIHLALPVENYSPVYAAEVSLHIRKKAVVLHEINFTVGFLKGDLPALLGQAKEKDWPFLVFRGFDAVSYTPPESKDPNIVFIPYPWEGVSLLEQSAQARITDVNVPVRVAANPKDTAEYWEAHKPKVDGN